MNSEKDPLTPELRQAERTLKTTLDEACSSNPLRADTGELIRIEEMLAIASDAAKRAVSIRRKLRQTGRTPASSQGDAGAAGDGDAGTTDAIPPEHRLYTDSHGVEWAVWSVHPTDRPSKRSHLRGSFSDGWLTFESAAEKRRLSPIPEHWQQLDDAGLEALCTVAEPAPPRTPRQSPGETTHSTE